MKLSVRLWQTFLFVTVITVAMLILSVTLFSNLERSVRDLSREQLSKDANELAGTIAPFFPLPSEAAAPRRGAPKASAAELAAAAKEARKQIHRNILRFEQTFDEDVWVYDARGQVVDSWQTRTTPGDLLARARHAVLTSYIPFTAVVQGTRNVAIAGATVRDIRGARQGGVVVATRGAESSTILRQARDQLLFALWIALGASGLLGFVFSEIITRQVQRISRVAVAMADGDFTQRVRRGPVPDEVAELGDLFNRMAEQLGKAFSQVKGQEREIAAVVESMAEGVLAVDSNKRIRLANPIASELLGKGMDLLVGKNVEEGVGSEKIFGPIDHALAGRQVTETVEFGRRVLMLHATPFATGEEEGGAVLLIRDITEQKRWEEAQREFTANASHELRTPIAAVKGFLELLESGAKERREIRDEFLHTMTVEIDRLQRLVSELFILAQLDSGEVRLDKRPQRAEEMIRDVVAVMVPLADDANIKLRADIGPGDLRVMCDRDRIVQVLLGFVDNALKHTPQGGSVIVWARDGEGRVRVGVHDSGAGIPADVAGKIFDRFYTKPDMSGNGHRGTGLGLAIAKEIVEAHDSRILVHSEPGKGADFSFTLERPPVLTNP